MRRGTITRILLWGVLPVLAALTGLIIWRRLEESYPIVGVERSRETQRLINLAMYATREESGALLPQRDGQIAIRERFLQDVLTRSLPMRESFKDGRYEARLDRARVDLQDGLAAITLYGHGRMLGENASPLEADLELQTHIDMIEFRPQVGTLRAGLAVTHAHVVRAGNGKGTPFLNPVARYFGGLKVEDWNRERPSVEIPIRVKQQLTLPELDGDVSLPSRSIPLDAHVSALTVLEHRVVLSLELERDPAYGEAPRPVTGDRLELTSALRARAEEAVRGLSKSGHFREKGDLLLKSVRQLAADDSLWQGIMESDRDVVAVVPQALIRILCDRIAQGYLQGALLDFDPDLRAHLDQKIRAKMLGRNVNAGRFYGDVGVTHLRGLLRVSGGPTLTFEPPDALDFATPVRVLKGEGRVSIDMHWDPNFLVSVICRKFGFQETLDGDVLPFSHMLHTRIRFATQGSRITGMPVVRRDRFSVPCEFTPSALGKVKAALMEQDRFLRCGIAMKPDTLLVKLRQLVRNNIRIALPKTLFKPFSLPVALAEEYQAAGFHISARARDPEVAVRPGYLRFGFGAALRVRTTGRPITPPRSSP